MHSLRDFQQLWVGLSRQNDARPIASRLIWHLQRVAGSKTAATTFGTGAKFLREDIRQLLASHDKPLAAHC
jgi:hypothetical protein